MKREVKKQEVKIEYNGTEVFFSAHSFKTAVDHANEFIERNKGKFTMKVYLLNTRPFGERWTYYKTAEVEEPTKELVVVNRYKEMKDRHQQEFNEFPMAFAFTQEQFKEGMESLGLTEKDKDKVRSIGAGGFIRKEDGPALMEMVDRKKREMQEAIDNDETGEGFVKDMFYYELANHEYSYTWDLEPTLDALGLTLEQVNANPKLLAGLTKAREELSQEDDE